MKKSRFCCFTKINDDVFAVYNNLIMDPLFLPSKIAKQLKYNEINKIPKKYISDLKKCCVLVSDDDQDEKAYKILKNRINEEIHNKISIMYIIPNNNCNLACKYCFIGKLNNEHPVKMSYDTMINAVDKFGEYAGKQDYKCKIIFYGGEPLLSFDNIEKVCEHIKNKGYGINLSIVTNGTLLTDEIMKKLKKYDFSVGLSIDGPKELNDKNRVFYNSNLGTYDLIYDKIKKMNDLGLNYGLSITVSNEVLDNQDNFLDWLKSTEAKSFSYNLLHFTHSGNDWKKYYNRINDFLIKSNNIMFQMGYSEDRIRRKYSSFYEKDFKYSDCAAKGGNQFAVKPNGDIVICHGYWNTKENRIGNINNDITVDDILKTQRYNDWYTNIPLNHKKCKNCKALYICGGGCAMQSRDVFKNEKNLDKAFCKHSKGMIDYLLKELYEEDVKNK